MWMLSRVLFTLGKVFFTAWEKRVLLMRAQTPPALQGKGGKVSPNASPSTLQIHPHRPQPAGSGARQ